MPARSRPWQETMEFINGLKGELLDEELATIKWYVERRSREAAQVTVTPVSTVQHCIPRSLSLNPETPSHVYVGMEEKDEGRMNPELTELEPPSAGTGLEIPGQQCPPNEGIWDTGRTIADGYLLVGMGSNQGGGISSPKERVGTQVGSAATPANSSNTIFRQQGHKPKGEDKGSEKNMQFDPRGKGPKPPPCNAAVILFFFPGGALSHGRLAVFLPRVLCLCVPVCLLIIIVPLR